MLINRITLNKKETGTTDFTVIHRNKDDLQLQID